MNPNSGTLPGSRPRILENTIAQVSRYLDRIGAPESSQKHALLMVAFWRRLRRYATKLNRLELVGGSGELSTHALGEGWIAQANARLELAGWSENSAIRMAPF